MVWVCARLRCSARATGVALGATWLALAAVCVGYFGNDIVGGHRTRARICRTEAMSAFLMRRLTRPGASVVAFAAGTLPYYSELRALDPLGRTDLVIARMPAHQGSGEGWREFATRPGHNKYDLHHTLVKLRPTLIALTAAPPCAWGEQDLRAWCREHYVSVRVNGLWLLFAAGSPLVRWDLLRRPAPAGADQLRVR